MLKSKIYPDAVIYGPYFSDDRFHVIVRRKGLSDKGMQYARFVMQEHLGYELPSELLVHHKDENPLNDEIWNLQVVDHSEHQKLHAKYNEVNIEHCAVCKKEMQLNRNQYRLMLKEQENGNISPCCSGKCRAKIRKQYPKKK